MHNIINNKEIYLTPAEVEQQLCEEQMKCKPVSTNNPNVVFFKLDMS